MVVNHNGAVVFCESWDWALLEARGRLGDTADWIVREVLPRPREPADPKHATRREEISASKRGVRGAKVSVRQDAKLLEQVEFLSAFDALRPSLLAGGHRGQFAIVTRAGLHAVRRTFFGAYRCAVSDLGERGVFLIQKVRAKERAPKERPQVREERLALERARQRVRER